MSTYPTAARAPFLEWCAAHAPVFEDHAGQIGLSVAQAEEFADAAAEAAAALLAQEQARQAALAATQAAKAAVRRLREAAGRTVRSVRAFAETQPVPLEVFNLAQIPPPAAPSPAAAPAQPVNLSAALDAATGALTLRWKASNPPGSSYTTYLVRRRVLFAPGVSPAAGCEKGFAHQNSGFAQQPSGFAHQPSGFAQQQQAAETAFTFVGVAGKKTFVDLAVPAGAAGVQYTVQGQRGNRAGPVSPILAVHFGKAALGRLKASAAA